MDTIKVVPSAFAKQQEDATIKAVGLDFWWTLAKIVRDSQFWTKAAVGGVIEPLLLIKSEMGLTNPALKLDQELVDAQLVHHWCTTHVHGDMKDYLEEVAEKLRAAGFRCKVTPAAVKKLKEITTQERKDFHVFPDVPEALQALKAQGLTLALLPNQSQFNSEKYLRSKMFGQYIDRVFWSYEMGLAKPDPRYFEQVLSELGIQPEEFLFVDDQPVNLLAARALGIKVVRIQREGKVLKSSMKSAMEGIPVIKDLSELVDGKWHVV